MIAIKGLEMPKCCSKCGNIEMCGDLKNKRNDFCPLIEVDKEGVPCQ